MVKYTVSKSKSKSMKKKHMRRKRMFGLDSGLPSASKLSKLSKLSNKFKKMSNKKKAAIGAGAVGGAALVAYELMLYKKAKMIFAKSNGSGDKRLGAELNITVNSMYGKEVNIFSPETPYSVLGVVKVLNRHPLVARKLTSKEVKEAKEEMKSGGSSFGKRRRRHRRRSANKRSFGKKRRTRRKSGKKSGRKHRKH